MNILLIGNGPFDDCTKLAQQCDRIIAVDGGANHCAQMGIAPDVIIGDGDSVSDDVRSRFENATWVAADDQDFSDLQKAMHYINASFERIDTIHLVSFTSGERFDHSFAAFFLLRDFADIPLLLHGPGWQARYITGTETVRSVPGQTVSFIALTPTTGVQSQGLRWELSDEVLRERSLSLSNEVVGDQCTVTVKRGGLVCIQQTE